MSAVTVRCSGIDDMTRCHGARLLRAIVGSITGTAASAGNWCHHRAASRLMQEMDAVHAIRGEMTTDPQRLPAPELLPKWKPSWFDEWMVDYYLRTVRETADVDMFLEVETGLEWELPLSRPMEVTVVEWVDGVPRLRRRTVTSFLLSGHLDAMAISPDGRYAKAWDLKTGEVPVDPADENWQVLGYILLLFLAYAELQEVTFYIVQPRNDDEEGWPRVSEVTVKREQMDALRESLTGEVEQALAKEMELSTGWKQCRYCDAATQCGAIRKETEEMKHLMASGELELIQQSPDTERLLEVFLSLKTLNSAYESAAEQVKGRVEQAGGALTWGDGRRAYIKEGNGGRTCQDMKQARERLAPIVGEEWDVCTKLKFDEAEKACAKALGLPHRSKVPGKDSGASKVKELLAGIVEQKTRKVLCIE